MISLTRIEHFFTSNYMFRSKNYNIVIKEIKVLAFV